MKSLISLIFLALGVATSAYGDPVTCFQEGSERTSLGRAKLVQLCSGTTTPWAPVGCFLTGKEQTNLGDTHLVQLCAGVNSLRPIACYENAGENTDLARRHKVELCATRTKPE
jgi:hypothetical protein